MRILVAGDSFCPSDAFRPAFEGLAARHDVRYVDVVDDPGWAPASPSERALEEYMGTPGQVIAALDGAEALIVQGAPVSDAVLAASPNLRVVGCARGGPVNVDLAAASALGIPVVTSPGKNADAVAELAISFMIMLARRLPEVVRHVEGGGAFGHDNYEGARWFGHDLAGHTLGLIGFGQIGRRVAVRAQAFAMSVLAFDPYVDPSLIEAAGCRSVDLPDLLASADVLSLHARATEENRGLIGRHEIASMKPGAYLVNTARDVLVDESALIEGLRSGHLAGVALDVVSPSPPSGRHPLLAFPNVVITAHVGGATHETLHHGAEMLAAEIERLLAEQPLVNVANRADLQPRTASGVA
jgi:D-3-phosphoglycerate dehydrogenase